MRINYLKATLKKTALVLTVLLLGAGMKVAHAQVNLTAGPTAAILPDGSSVPMWGYSCGTVVTGATATCAKLNPTATGWSPVVITVATGQTLTINLTNSLIFGTYSVPTSIMIVGQVGGGLGTVGAGCTGGATCTAAPSHANAQAASTWPIAGNAPGGTPPVQGKRVQSFATEVGVGTTTPLSWTNLRPGTYLIESGTHPSIQGPMGLYGILVVTTAPVGTTAGTAYPAAGTVPAVTYNAEVPLLLSEIDPVQNNAVATAVVQLKFNETMVWSGLPGGCGNPATLSTSATPYRACYPPTVNYTPLYYMINGAAFNKTGAAASLFPALPATTATTGNVLVRFVNAGLHMHVPAIVGAQTGATPASGFTLIAEDGNPLPGIARVQNEVFMAAGKTYDVMMNAPAVGTTALPVYDRELSLSGNKIERDAGMLAYISVNGSLLPAAAPLAAAVARADTYASVVTGVTLTVSDPSKGVLANDTNVYGVKIVGTAPAGLTLNEDGTFVYTAGTPTSFTYCGNGTLTGAACALVTLGAAPVEAGTGITMGNQTYTSTLSTFLKIASPGLLSADRDSAGYALTVAPGTVAAGPATAPALALAPCAAGARSNCVAVDASGAFNAYVPGAGTYVFNYKAQNTQKTVSGTTASVTLIFPAATGLQVSVVDGADKTTAITDYRWIIEEDRTFFIDPTKTTNTGGTTIVPTFGTNFHTSFMPVVATGCTGALSCESGQTLLGQFAVCDVGNGVCRTTGTQNAPVFPSQVHLDPTKRYYLSILPGDAANPFDAGNVTATCTIKNAASTCGHGMGGAPIAAGQTVVKVLAQPTPFPPSKLSVFVFEDDFPLNGENDAGGQVVDTALATQEPGLGQFNITIMDDAGGPGDPTGQVDYDMFNQPLSNGLAGTKDPSTGLDACPIGPHSQIGVGDPNQTGITGTIVTCPKYESDGVHESPLAGQAVVNNMMPGRYGIIATPGADRIGRGEEWLQTNTLDGQKAHDSFLRVGEPSFFQEYGPAGYHVTIGFANPKIIQSRLATVCSGNEPTLPVSGGCPNTITGKVTTERMSRTPDERLYSSGSNDSFGFTQCYVSFGDPDGEDFAFTKCAADGTFSIAGLPNGDWRVTVFDQWNDMLVDGLSTPVRLAGGTTNLGDIATNQWQANIYTRTFLDVSGDGVSQAAEPGLALVKTNIRFRDGSFSNRNNTDLDGFANFNEEFPLFSWYVVETDVTRYKNTGTHVVYDAGGPADGTPCGTAVGTAPCGTSTIGKFKANTVEQIPLPTNLRVPGGVYCSNADCTGFSIATGPIVGGSSGPATGVSTGRIDPPWVLTEAWQGFSGQNNFLEFGKKLYAVGENGGVRGHVVYSSTRPFDDPQFNTQNVWEPLVPNVTINLYREGTAPDGTTSLTLVDTTKTSSWDDWAQGFRSDGVPNMNCPGQGTNTGTDADIFFFSLFNQPDYLDAYNNGGVPAHTIPFNSQYKCYDGMHNWNQLQPAPYDGMYQFPSVTGRNPTTGNTTGTNCTICVKNPDPTDTARFGKEDMLPKGKYVTEVVIPPGYELVKEEDKNILIGDNFIAPITQEIPGLGSAIFILPDQAEVASTCNANSSSQNPTCSLGRNQQLTSHEGDTPTVDTFWPCVGTARVVPDFISLFPGSAEVAPFAGSFRNLCDRKEVTLDDQTSAQAEFFVWTETHAAAHFTGVITDDFTSEFDPYSPQFGEKFSPPDMPVSIKDWTGNEISRVYADHWGSYNGLTYSTWEVNPPNPTGYSPTMMITCMNDPGTGPTPDPLFNPQYSQFCYEIPFMPGQTQYMDTPVVPTSAFAGAGYNNPDCSYPAATPAIKEVDGSGIGPWVSAAGQTLTITGLGNQFVPNNAYAGPQATTSPYNLKTIPRHYGFGATKGSVTIGGTVVPSASITTWSDESIILTVPTGVPNCTIQQQAQYGGPGTVGVTTAQCGELIITTAPSATYPAGQQSVDTVMVTIGGKTPTHVAASASIQPVIDAARPGDMIIIDPTCTQTVTATGVTSLVSCSSTAPTGAKIARSNASHKELLLMWKPLRLQGVGAASSLIDGSTHPAGKLDVWRRQVTCLFGLTISGVPITTGTPYDPSGTFSCTPAMQFSVDRLPLEATVGWDATLNGNLAQLLQEPTLMGALEGAAITVLSKGVDFHGQNPWASDIFPVGTTLLTPEDCGANTTTAKNPFPSDFQCNPSRIDGLGISDSSQGGGGIFVHAWGHNLEISNDRVNNNAGTLSGGINVGQGEFPAAYLGGAAGATNAAPGTCQPSAVNGIVEPYCHNINVNIHNNAITSNSSTGDELFSATPAGAGGITFCTGADFYKFNFNWVCGNLSTGDGGGLAHIGVSYNGLITHNTFLFNQSTNPTISTNGGGVLVMGAPDADPACPGTADTDCVVAPGAVGPSDGVGPGLAIDSNLIMGNAADAGSGGGLRLQNVNGSDVVAFPTTPANWWRVTVTNNIIANNVAGWDGAGISLLDALNTNIVNNTVIDNDTTATAGPLFNTLGAPLASSSGPTCTTNCGTTSLPQPAGVVSIQNSAVLVANLPASITCPPGHFAGATATNGTCRAASFPVLDNNLIWQNRAFYIGVGGLAPGIVNQQNVVTLYNAFTTTQAISQPQADATTANGGGVIITGGTGACVAASYWDVGVRGDTGPANHASSVTLNPQFSVLTSIAGYNANNIAGNPRVRSQYCNGSRVPPELGSAGYQVPPGVADATVPNPVFNLTPAATVDEGNNWINMSWGPLTLSNPVTNVTLGNYAPTSTSSVINLIPSTANGTLGAFTLAPATDFFGNARKGNGFVDAGAVEFFASAAAAVTVAPATLVLPKTAINTTSASSATFQVTVTNSGAAAFTGLTTTFTGRFSRGAGGTCTATLAGGTACTIRVVFSPNALGLVTGTLAVTGSVAVTPATVALSGTGVAAVVAATFLPATFTYPAQVRNCPGTTTAQITACNADPLHLTTLTNTGNVPLTGVTAGALGGTHPTEFAIVTSATACGTGANTTLAPGATCTIGVRFKPLTAQTTGVKTATISVNDLAGTKTATLTGTAN